MRTDTPPLVHLIDYEPFPFALDKVSLIFQLNPEETKVTTTIEGRRTGESTDLVLDGIGLELKSVRIGRKKPNYTQTETQLIIHDIPDEFKLKTEVIINPSANKSLMGLYTSGGRYCTQCEAEGFRKITYWPDRPDVLSRFHVRIEGDKEKEPFLLSNGNLLKTGSVSILGGSGHYAEWEDPHPKPSYLFALCAGDYDVLEDSFTTSEGVDVKLAIHVDAGDAPNASWAMDCLKRAMKWDEDVFGRAYDSAVFNIVAVRDFNFGAMENKGLNIFNSAYVLADPEEATDADYEAIESIVAHEYFHNWTGNRITCRDWFQLCLKEGLTVYRDQLFSADMRSPAVQRIKDVRALRSRQFPEDGGPLAHAVRPDSYASIDNLYTATVYEKGAEIIRMLRALIGDQAFFAGMTLYFDRFDGQAVTIEDFYGCFEESSGEDLSDFQLWYSQPGTPAVSVQSEFSQGRMTVTLGQSTPETPDHKDKAPFTIPLRYRLLDARGKAISNERMTVLDTEKKRLVLKIDAKIPEPRLSINRDFSAPIELNQRIDSRASLSIAKNESDPFRLWDSLYSATQREMLYLAQKPGKPPRKQILEAIAAAARRFIKSDPAYAALLLTLPTVRDAYLKQKPYADPAALLGAQKSLKAGLWKAIEKFAKEILEQPPAETFDPGAKQAGERALLCAVLSLLSASGTKDAAQRIGQVFDAHSTMTVRLNALGALSDLGGADYADRLAAFYDRWQERPLVIDKWFGLQARNGSVEDVDALMLHKDFTLDNPNRVRAVISSFSHFNLAEFHRVDGAGYALLADVAKKADSQNPALAARLLGAFEQWRAMSSEVQALCLAQLEGLAAGDLSKNSADIIGRILAAPILEEAEDVADVIEDITDDEDSAGNDENQRDDKATETQSNNSEA